MSTERLILILLIRLTFFVLVRAAFVMGFAMGMLMSLCRIAVRFVWVLAKGIINGSETNQP